MGSKNYLKERIRSRVTPTQPAGRDTKHDLQEIGEFGIIRRIRKWMDTSDPALVQGIGDDVAVIEMGSKLLLATTDILIEDIHFKRSWTNPYALGTKALAVNLSDIASMGGIPKYFLISLGLPKDTSLSFVSAFYRGLKKESKRFQVELVGGDTSLAEKIIINICLLGEGKRGDLLFRKGAKVGDDLFVSGTLGDAALGLKILQKRGKTGKPVGLVKKHLFPCPRVELGQSIAKRHWANAMMDISDGLLIDVSHLLEESKVGARIWEEAIPLSRLYRKWVTFFSKDPLGFALTGGEDYELLFTAPGELRERILELGRSLRIPITRVGKILPSGEGLQIVKKRGGTYSPSRLGFDHFQTSMD